jgi:50S ribosomal protein L16 3-hydroxylase
MKPSLDALLHPRPRAEFLAAYRADAPFVVHGAKAAVASLLELPFLASLDALLNSWPATIAAHLPEVADEASSIEASPRDARKLFDSGMGLRFDHADAISPHLGVWLDALRRDLGLSALTQARCLIYATPHGKGTAPHFDQNVNLVLQVHGTKTWRLAPNHHVVHPMTRHTMGMSADAELQTYARAPLPVRMPDDCAELVLTPGSVLVVPRGVWHATVADGDALALNFTFSAPTWIDVFTAALRSRLAVSEAWRATAAPASVDDFAALLADLAHDVPHWRAADVLEATEAEPG